MKKQDILRAWKDEDFYLSLSEAERAALPANPVGVIELSDGDLTGIAGGSDSTVEACSVPRTACQSTNFCTACLCYTLVDC